MIPLILADGSDNPLWFDSVCHVTVDEAGRILGAGQTSTGAMMQKIEAGFTVVRTAALMKREDSATYYVDVTGAAPFIRTRPVIDWGFDKPTVPPRQLATLARIPGCTVAFTGPLKGQQAHEAGDLQIGFTMPGTYEITFEAFPYLPAAFTLKVEALPNSVSASASVK